MSDRTFVISQKKTKRFHMRISQDIADHLDTKENASAYVQYLIRMDMDAQSYDEGVAERETS